jgi:transcriptional regulator with XRE-family HTH domain
MTTTTTEPNKLQSLRLRGVGSVRELARRTGLDPQTLRSLETGDGGNPRLRTLERVGSVYGLTAAQVIARMGRR